MSKNAVFVKIISKGGATMLGKVVEFKFAICDHNNLVLVLGHIQLQYRNFNNRRTIKRVLHNCYQSISLKVAIITLIFSFCGNAWNNEVKL